jgi:PAS domain S-box-containing protein
MADKKRTKAELIEELTKLRRQLAELERQAAAREVAEEALRTEKAFLDELFENAPEAVVLVTNDSFILRANRFFTNVFGYEEKEVVGKNIDEILAPHDLTDEALGYTQQAASGERLYAETVRRHKDGTLVDVSILGVPIRVSGGQVAVYGIYRDITGRKRAEKALRDSEERHRKLFESTPIGLGVADGQGNLLAFNEGILKPGGYTREDIEQIGNVGALYAEPEERVRVLAKAAQQGFLRQEEVRFKRKDGGHYTALLSLTPVQIDGGTGWQAMVEDITERKRAEEVLLREKHFSDMSIDALPGIFYLVDEDGKFLRWNKNLPHVSGYTDQEIAQMHPLDFLEGEERDRMQRGMGEVLARGHATVEMDMVAKNGSRIPYFFTAHRIQLDERQCIIGTGINIAERRRVEDELRRSESKYRALVEHATYGIYRANADGCFLSANPALVEMLGYESEVDLLQAERCEETYANDAERERLVELCGNMGRIVGMEMEWRKKDGRRVTVRLSGRPLTTESGELEAYQMIAEDVTEHRVLEAQLRQAQKMEAIGQLTGGIAHDFNNVLTVILANADLISSGLPRELTQARADVEDVQAAARRGSTLIRKLLGFSRRERLEVHPTDLTLLVSELSGVLKRVVPESIEIQVVAGEAEATVLADPGAVEQIVLNLATNSRDAMPDGGILRIEVTRTWLDEGYRATHPWVEPGEYVCVTCSDTGMGMDASTQERVFEPFFTTKPPGEGTGLGMAMIYGLVKQHGGYVHVYSEVEQGTTVNVYFPAASGEVGSAVDEVIRFEELRGRGETILLVEDEDGIRRATKRALEGRGYEVLVAEDGEEALEMFHRHEAEIDLIVSDLVMPRLGGRQFYEALKKEGKDPRILFTSGYSVDDVKAGSGFLRDVPFLHKPWTLTDLFLRVRQVLDHEHEATRRHS